MADVYTRNTVSGQLGWVPEEYLEHPWFGKQLVLADEDEKPGVPELHKSKTADEHAAAQKTKADAKNPDAVD